MSAGQMSSEDMTKHDVQVRSRREQRGKEKDIWKRRLQEERQKAVQQGKLTRHVQAWRAHRVCPGMRNNVFCRACQVTGARALTRGLEVGPRPAGARWCQYDRITVV